MQFLLERGADPDNESGDHAPTARTAMDHAVFRSDAPLADLLRRYGAAYGAREAAALNRIDEVQRLLEKIPGLLVSIVQRFSVNANVVGAAEQDQQGSGSGIAKKHLFVKHPLSGPWVAEHEGKIVEVRIHLCVAVGDTMSQRREVGIAGQRLGAGGQEVAPDQFDRDAEIPQCLLRFVEQPLFGLDSADVQSETRRQGRDDREPAAPLEHAVAGHHLSLDDPTQHAVDVLEIAADELFDLRPIPAVLERLNPLSRGLDPLINLGRDVSPLEFAGEGHGNQLMPLSRRRRLAGRFSRDRRPRPEETAVRTLAAHGHPGRGEAAADRNVAKYNRPARIEVAEEAEKCLISISVKHLVKRRGIAGRSTE